ncbi:hypothetical protein CYLTODRAFT_76989 [Cylindrobasidium torrendii FP15055 ss-10]|uniref:Uncharacterized protein n=1 Tax=Cylindrobasidium torrendii FP15055 ss-10 TaxID=1314674 RepID=A0A0D7B341_9AGAR|nr:hypothetical protein CYLTODRAFT_76989 [Cylindrobasidium torrendii FP15055 ss-10]
MSARQQFIPGGGGGAAAAAANARPSTARTNTPALRPSQDTPGGSNRPLNIDNFPRKGSGSQKLLSILDNTKDKSHSTPLRRLNTSTTNVHAPRPVLPSQSISPALVNHGEDLPVKKAHTSRNFFAGDMFPPAPLAQSESSSRLVAKRNHAEYDDEQEGDDSYEFGYSTSKRYKADNVRSLLSRSRSSFDVAQNEIQYPTDNLAAQASSPMSARHSDYQHDGSRRTHSPQPRSGHLEKSLLDAEREPSQSASQAVSEVGALQKILGCDPDLYVETHLETYNSLAEKWKTCTPEEWIAGADGQIAQFRDVCSLTPWQLSWISMSRFSIS